MNYIQNNPRIGFRDGLPIGLGYFAISFAFGLMSISYGLTIAEATMMSAFNLTSAGQMAALPIITSGGGFIELALTQLLINLRYSLMSISLSQKFDKNIRLRDRFYLAFTVADEIYAVSIGRDETLGKKYLTAILIPPYLGWTLGTLLGAVAGNILPEIIVTALGISMYAMFIAIIVPVVKKDSAVLITVILSMAASSAFKYLPLLSSVPNGFVIIICALLVSVLMAAIKPIPSEEEMRAKYEGGNEND